MWRLVTARRFVQLKHDEQSEAQQDAEQEACRKCDLSRRIQCFTLLCCISHHVITMIYRTSNHITYHRCVLLHLLSHLRGYQHHHLGHLRGSKALYACGASPEPPPAPPHARCRPHLAGQHVELLAAGGFRDRAARHPGGKPLTATRKDISCDITYIAEHN